MATPSGAVFLVGGIICSLLPPSPPMAGRLIGGSFCVPALLHFMQCRLRCLGRGGCCAAQLRCLLLLADGGSLALADALPPYSCSLVDALPPVVTSSLADALPLFLYAGGYFAAVVVLFGGCFATVSCFKLALLGIFGDNFLCRSSSSGGFCLGGLCGESSPSVFPLLPACCISGYGRMCACLYFFFSVSFIFSPLCSCVGQVLFGRNKFVSVTAFFLMKNVLRHGREKEDNSGEASSDQVLLKGDNSGEGNSDQVLLKKSGGGPERSRYMYRLMTFVLKYDKMEDLRVKCCRVRYYNVPKKASPEFGENPAAFWL